MITNVGLWRRELVASYSFVVLFRFVRKTGRGVAAFSFIALDALARCIVGFDSRRAAKVFVCS